MFLKYQKSEFNSAIAMSSDIHALKDEKQQKDCVINENDIAPINRDRILSKVTARFK